MSTVDREVVLEALSVLVGTTVKPRNGLAGKLDPNELNIHNFLPKGFLKQIADLFNNHLQQATLVGFNSDVREEMFVDMDEFFEPRFDYDFTHLSDKSVCMRVVSHINVHVDGTALLSKS